MSHKDVYAAVSKHVQCTHMEWPNDEGPRPPFACYLLDYDKPVMAGNEQVAVKRKWIVELYERKRDKALEKALADTLRESFGSVRRDESWVENENVLLVTYSFYEIEGKEDFDG